MRIHFIREFEKRKNFSLEENSKRENIEAYYHIVKHFGYIPNSF